MPLTLCAWNLNALDWSVGVEIEGLAGDHARLVEERWPAYEAPHLGTLRFKARAASTGLPPNEHNHVHASVTWVDGDRASVRGNSVELEVSFKDGRIDGEGVLYARYAVGGLEAAHRALLVLWLARQGVLVLHASAVVHEGQAVVFFGESGAGKTTTARRLGREGFRRISDDMIAVDLRGSEPLLVPLPFERGSRPVVAVQPTRCVGALCVKKGAATLGVSGEPDPLRRWSEAVVTLAPGPAHATTVLGAFVRLARLPLGVLLAPPTGKLSDVVMTWITTATALDPPALTVDSAPLLSHTARVAPSSDRTFIRAANVAWRVLDGSAVLVAPGSPAIRTLNAVGTRVWELADGRDVAEIVDAVVNEFEVSRTQAEQDVNTFIESLKGQGLLTVATPAA